MNPGIRVKKILSRMTVASMRCATDRSAFTLLELLVAIGIVAFLAAVVFTAGRSALNSTKTTQSLSNLKAIGAGLSQYLVDNNFRYPMIFENEWISPFWSEKLTPYLSEAPNNHLDPYGNKISVSSSMMDPFLARKEHHSLGDYGGNDRIFLYPSVADIGLSASAIARPSLTVTVVSASQPMSGGERMGCWFLDSAKFQSGNGSVGVPDDRGTGSVFCLYADGHVELVPLEVLRGGKGEVFSPY